jgi:putative phosphoesterase
MKIGIISDTHGNIGLLESTADWLIQRQKIAVLYHLGDDYDDVKCLGDRFIEIVQVPGLYDNRYKDGSLPAKLFEQVQGLTILITHSYEKDATKEDLRRSDIIVSGHTHKEEIRLLDGRLYINPGHLKGPLDKNMPPSFGLLTLLDRSVSVAIYGENFKPIRTMELVRSESGLYKTS